MLSKAVGLKTKHVSKHIKYPATLQSSATIIAQHAPIAETSSERSVLALLIISVAISVGILLSLRLYKSSSVK